MQLYVVLSIRAIEKKSCKKVFKFEQNTMRKGIIPVEHVARRRGFSCAGLIRSVLYAHYGSRPILPCSFLKLDNIAVISV